LALLITLGIINLVWIAFSIRRRRRTVPPVVVGTTVQERIEAAIRRCHYNISWYKSREHWSRDLYKLSQGMIILLGPISVVLAYLEFPNESSSDASLGSWISISDTNDLLSVVPAVLASVLAALSGLFHWRDNWHRFGLTSETLKSELYKFQTRTDNYSLAKCPDDERALEVFMKTIEKIVMDETRQWAQQTTAGPV
jgi:hypothetical protein